MGVMNYGNFFPGVSKSYTRSKLASPAMPSHGNHMGSSFEALLLFPKQNNGGAYSLSRITGPRTLDPLKQVRAHNNSIGLPALHSKNKGR